MAQIDDVRDLIGEIGEQSILPPPPLAVSMNGGSIPLPRRLQNLDFLFQQRASSFSSRSFPVQSRVPSWWTPGRDRFLWETVFGSDVMSSAIFSTSARLVSAPVSIVPRDKDNRNQRRIAHLSEMLLQYYWTEVAFQFAMDWQTQDNGAFLEIQGAGDPGGPIEPTKIPGTNDYLYGTGLRILDSQQCTRSGDPDYPVVYRYRGQDNVVRYYKFHNSRIIFSSQMPSTRQGMYSVGFSGASRAIHNVLRLDDIRILEDETIGVRPATQLIFGKVISSEDMNKAFEVAERKAATDGKSRASYMVFMGVQGNPETVKAADLKIIDLKKFPDGYNPEMNMNIAMNVIAMALGFDSREFWPATVRGATRADADIQDRKSRSKTHGIWRATMTNELNRKWCPNIATASFDKQDEEMDILMAEIVKTRSESRASDLTNNVLDRVVIWQQMLEDSEINEAQYAYLLAQQAKMEAEMARNNVANGDGNGNNDNTNGDGSGSSGDGAAGDGANAGQTQSGGS